ncbi:PDZ domain-containing protein [Phocaeicola coprocola]|uniref:PDZ domain-containing protein n=1 Tax=Phocaeicola coprocola TaxID=310298 RepID=UPI0019577784|nr:PDZ domain-containing protein [Phocaeicola coprocola]MBM6712616.1 PDZ domain-containing protein [Phocaeicola coprocola]
MTKKVFKYLFRILAILLICLFVYFVYISVWVKNFNTDQRKAVENINANFYQTFPIIRDPNGYFGVIATVNGQYTDTLLFDTQASTSLAKQETLDRYEAVYWKRKPMPTFNFYKQVYFSKLYKVNDVTLGGCKLEGVVFTSVPKDNGMYNALYRPVLGRTIMENMVWKFDMDKNEMTVFSLKNKEKLEQETTGFTLVEDGVNNLPLYSEQTDSLNLMLDLGSNYDVIIDKDVYEKLRQHHVSRKYVNFRREGLTDTIAEFSGITMYCNGVAVPNCVLDYIPSINKNVAGNIFAGKMNFILAGENLYIKQHSDTLLNDFNGFPALGLGINIRNGSICITALEINGPAEKSGLMLGDKVIAVNNGAVSVDAMFVSNGKLEKYIQQANSLTIEIERNGKRQTFNITRKSE